MQFSIVFTKFSRVFDVMSRDYSVGQSEWVRIVCQIIVSWGTIKCSCSKSLILYGSVQNCY